MSKKRLHTKRTTLHFVVGNEQRFPLLLGTNNTLRISMVLSQTESALVIKISQRYCLLTVWNSDLFSICFFGRLDFFFSGDITKISGNMTQVSGDMTSGENGSWIPTPTELRCLRLWRTDRKQLLNKDPTDRLTRKLSEKLLTWKLGVTF